MDDKPRIGNMEWIFFLVILATIDLVQVCVEWLTIWFGGFSIVINFYIDLAVAVTMPLYLRLRGQTVTKPSQIFGILGTFVLEMVPGIDELPLWCLDGFFYMRTAKAEYRRIDKEKAEAQAAQDAEEREEEEARMRQAEIEMQNEEEEEQEQEEEEVQLQMEKQEEQEVLEQEEEEDQINQEKIEEEENEEELLGV